MKKPRALPVLREGSRCQLVRSTTLRLYVLHGSGARATTPPLLGGSTTPRSRSRRLSRSVRPSCTGITWVPGNHASSVAAMDTTEGTGLSRTSRDMPADGKRCVRAGSLPGRRFAPRARAASLDGRLRCARAHPSLQMFPGAAVDGPAASCPPTHHSAARAHHTLFAGIVGCGQPRDVFGYNSMRFRPLPAAQRPPHHSRLQRTAPARVPASRADTPTSARARGRHAELTSRHTDAARQDAERAPHPGAGARTAAAGHGWSLTGTLCAEVGSSGT